MENKNYEYKGWKCNGIVALLLNFVALAGTIYLIVEGGTRLDAGEPFGGAFLGVGIFLTIVALICFGGYMLLEPNQARVMTFFGEYRGTFYKTGYWWVNPLLGAKQISVRARNLNVDPIKVNDKAGNPILIGLVLVWKIKNEGAYKAVFIGTHLQHPMRLTQQTCLNIDLENEEYDIIWNGNINGWNNLPQKVREKEIALGSYTFEKKYYNPTTVPYSSGVRDDANTTLTLNVPKLQPQINQITLQYNHPEAVVGVAIPHLPLEQIKGSVLFFKGEEFAHEWEVMPLICGNYKCDKFSFSPCDCQNGIYPVNIIKMQQIFLQILQDGNIQTKQWFDSIDIRNIKTNKKIEKRPLGNDISILIGAEEDFLQNYIVTFSGNGYRISNPQFAGNTFYHISIIKNENSTTNGKEPPTRKVYLELSKKIEINQLSATINGCNISIDTNSSSISIEKQEHRKNIKFSYNGLPLKSRNKDQDRIKLTLTLWGLIKLNVRAILLVAGIGLLLSLLVIMWFRGFDLKKWFIKDVETECFDPDRVDNGTPATPATDTKTITEDQRLYNELDSILKIQREQWNYRTITDLVGKYNNTTVIEDNHIAYSLYKELVWMQCRYRFDGYKKDDLTVQYTTHKDFQNNKLDGGWIHGITIYCIQSERAKFATDDIMEFLKDVINASNAKQKEFFEQYVKNKKVEKNVKQSKFQSIRFAGLPLENASLILFSI